MSSRSASNRAPLGSWRTWPPSFRIVFVPAGLVSASQALTTSREDGAIVVAVQSRPADWKAAREPQLLRVRIGTNAQVSTWASLAGDGMGSILDPDALTEQIAGLLRLVGGLRAGYGWSTRHKSRSGLGSTRPAKMVSTGRLAQLPSADFRTVGWRKADSYFALEKPCAIMGDGPTSGSCWNCRTRWPRSIGRCVAGQPDVLRSVRA